MDTEGCREQGADAGDDVDRNTDGADCMVPHCLKGTGDEANRKYWLGEDLCNDKVSLNSTVYRRNMPTTH